MQHPILHPWAPSLISRHGALLGWTDKAWVVGSGTLSRYSTAPPRRIAFYAPGFFLQVRKPWFTFSKTEICRPQAGPPGRTDGIRQWSPPQKDSFLRSFAYAQSAIAQGKLGKAVLWAESLSEGHLDAPSRGRVTAHLLRAPRSVHPYGLWYRNSGFLGASPEWLFRLSKDGVLSTMALAGTQAADKDPKEFWSDAKERWEHDLVVTALREELKPLGEVREGKTQILELPRLRHFKTPFQVKLKRRVDFAELVAALHPTPALGTAPRAEWRWLARLPENRRRAHFGGPFGVRFADGSGGCLVLIRGVHWDPKVTRLPAGCGIVRQSRAAGEWKEVQCKQQAARQLMGL